MGNDFDDEFLRTDPFKEKLKKIPNCVRLRLNETGKSANELTRTIGDSKQTEYGDQPIWHCKPDLDAYVKNKIGFTDEEVKRTHPSGANIFYQEIAHEITKLRNSTTIVDWSSDVRTGVWRMRFSDNISSVEPPVGSTNYWIWSVDPKNWEIVKNKNIWASKIEQKIRDRVRPGDKVIFYVIGTKEFQGIFEFFEEWYDAKKPVWDDETDTILYQSQIKLKPLKIASVNVYDVSPKLQMFSTPNDKRLVNLVLKGGGGYPSNNGKPILYEDYKILFDSMSFQNNYFIITQNPDSKYDNIPGKQHAYDSWKQHSAQFVEETKFIVKSKINGTNYFVGYGTVDKITSTPTMVNDRNQIKKIASFKNYVKFDHNRIQTKDMTQRMYRIAYPNSDNSSRPPSMLPIPEELYNEIIDDASLMSKDIESTLPFLTSKEIDDGYRIISKELLISKDKILEILTALLSGRHVLLAGPIGTGKTRLAMDIPPIFWKKYGGYDAIDHTATSDWSTLDVIGGILPKVIHGTPTYQIQDGCVVSTVRKNSEISTTHSKYTDIPYAGTWLVIDEFNRAEIDKAFGQLFTALRTQNLKIPTITDDDYEDLKILKDYRIIGTLNTADKHFLFNLSDALKSRFAYIEVDIPTRKQFETEIYFAMRNALKDLDLSSPLPFHFVLDETNKKIDENKSNKDFYRKVMQAYYVLDTVRIFKKLGPAVLKLIYQNLIVGTIISQDSKNSLDNALTSNLIPQLEHESSQSLEIIRALHTNSLNPFITKAYDDQADKESYLNSFEKLFDYLEISNKDKFLLDFKNGNFAQDDDRWNDVKEKYSAKKENFELSLEEWPKALAELKKSKVF